MNLIVAHDRHFGIGYQNRLPWHLPEDLRRFKESTINKTVIMGSKTANALGMALPNRRNIVVSRSKLGVINGFEFMRFEEALSYANRDSFVIGGAETYRAFFPYCDRLYVTKIDLSYITDTQFEYDLSDFTLTSEESHIAPEGTEYSFSIYNKK